MARQRCQNKRLRFIDKVPVQLNQIGRPTAAWKAWVIEMTQAVPDLWLGPALRVLVYSTKP